MLRIEYFSTQRLCLNTPLQWKRGCANSGFHQKIGGMHRRMLHQSVRFWEKLWWEPKLGEEKGQMVNPQSNQLGSLWEKHALSKIWVPGGVWWGHLPTYVLWDSIWEWCLLNHDNGEWKSTLPWCLWCIWNLIHIPFLPTRGYSCCPNRQYCPWFYNPVLEETDGSIGCCPICCRDQWAHFL